LFSGCAREYEEGYFLILLFTSRISVQLYPCVVNENDTYKRWGKEEEDDFASQYLWKGALKDTGGTGCCLTDEAALMWFAWVKAAAHNCLCEALPLQGRTET